MLCLWILYSLSTDEEYTVCSLDVLKISVNSSSKKFCYRVPEVVFAVVQAPYPSSKRGSCVGGEHAGPAWHSMVPECIWLP
jgi:hypothetical protein